MATKKQVEKPEETQPNADLPELPPGYVAVKQESLDEVIERLEDQQAEIDSLKTGMRESSIPVKGEKKKLFPRVHLKIWTEGDSRKVITSWKSSKRNRIMYSESSGMPMGEILKATYYFADGGDTGEIDQIMFTRLNDIAYGTVIEEYPDRNTVLVKLEDSTLSATPIEVNKIYLNA